MSHVIIHPDEVHLMPGIPLATKAGEDIPNEQRLEQAPERMRATVDLWTNRFPRIRVRSASATYNCYGLVFANRRTCIEPAYVERILEEDGYRPVDRRAEITKGDIVLYRNGGRIVHAALVLSTEPNVERARWEICVLSQWGSDGEYIHPLDSVPAAYGTATDFWTERRTL